MSWWPQNIVHIMVAGEKIPRLKALTDLVNGQSLEFGSIYDFLRRESGGGSPEDR